MDHGLITWIYGYMDIWIFKILVINFRSLSRFQSKYYGARAFGAWDLSTRVYGCEQLGHETMPAFVPCTGAYDSNAAIDS